MRENINKFVKFVVVERFILIVCIMYNNLPMKYLLKVNRLAVKRVFMQHIFLHNDNLSENFLRYSVIHFKMFYLCSPRCFYIIKETILKIRMYKQLRFKKMDPMFSLMNIMFLYYLYLPINMCLFHEIVVELNIIIYRMPLRKQWRRLMFRYQVHHEEHRQLDPCPTHPHNMDIINLSALHIKIE